MIRIYFLYLILFFGFLCSYAQDNDSLVYKEFYYSNGKKSSEGLLKNGKPDGYWKNYYENGSLKSEGNRKDYLLDSLWIFYDENGNLLSKISYKESKKNGKKIDYNNDKIIEENYKDDIKDGIEKVYYKNGKLKKQMFYSKGKIDSLSLEYSENGLINTISNYDKGKLITIEYINRIDRNGLKQGIWKTFYTGIITKTECKYNDDKLNGYLKEYSIDGQILKIEKYENGNLIKNVEEIETPESEIKYYKTGIVKQRGFYRSNMKDGIWVNYDSLGDIEATSIYKKDILLEKGITDKAGLKQGTWEEYYETGDLKGKGNYVNGEKDGKWLYLFKNGNVNQEGEYANGRCIGLWKWYYENGKELRTETFKNGLEEGIMTDYGIDGQIITKGKYEEGMKQGEWFLKVGDYKEEGVYVDNEKDGIWKHYYESGKLSFIGEYMYGEPFGKHTYYYENGNVMEEGTYKNGKKNGIWKLFTEEGILLITIEFQDDMEIKIDNKIIK
ncbi:MAG: hypothetical protein A2X12_01910 [Bacteroidetes bacterium GWE2_29_8]|nr:MAG: hypothetical protein A2X12_01910 [Bacteroidetes bacterium GWE2_29_8]